MTPLILSTWHFGRIAGAAGWRILERGGSALDAVEAACAAVEEDPEVTSVGYGGFPDASGEVTLDAVIMADPCHCGAVACLRGFVPAISVARRVMEKTSHVLLVGPKAEEFAAREGFLRRELLTDRARQAWQEWKARQPWQGELAGYAARIAKNDEQAADHDTIGVLAYDQSGGLAGACSTSGLAFKLPGRVGDSPIIGHGLYVDPDVGAAVGTGHGELIMRVCGAFLIVEEMRREKMPHVAIRNTLQRIAEKCRPLPKQQAAFIALRKDGIWAAGALRLGFQVALRSADEDSLLMPHVVLWTD
ncbi:MAG: N(4)-(beta-N-acetylglucosaminyl)-L-asparaginase [Thermogutta sp.]